MLKRTLGMVLVCIIMINCFVVALPVLSVYAFNNFRVEVVKNNAPLREGYYESENVIKRYPKGIVITVVGEKKNLWGNLWYKIEGGGYIYNENVKKTNKKHEHFYKLTHYESAHPHYANYECPCGGGYCGTETTKKTGCAKCYPHEHTYQLTHYEDAHPHYANYKCSCGGGYCGTETTKKTGCAKCYPHEHTYQLTHYEDAHPHYANYACKCGSGYCGTETTKVDGCSKCYPKEEVHKCTYKIVDYEDAHPHYAIYECDCGNGYCGTKTKKMNNCNKCYPKEDDDSSTHSCKFIDNGKRRKAHPHYIVEECSICAKERENTRQTEKFFNCLECINGINYNNFNSPINFNFYNINKGQSVYVRLTGIETDNADATQGLHNLLDVCGFAAPEPFAMVCDGVNTAFFLVEGDFINAGLSSVAFIPIVGSISKAGKLNPKAGTAILDVTSGAMKATTRVVVKNADMISEAAEEIVKNASRYSDDVLDTIGKISSNKSVSIKKVYNNGDLLISKQYTGTITSPSGLKYVGATDEGHRLHHVIERHGANLRNASGDHGTLFNVDGEELFDLLDDVYKDGNIVGKPVLQNNGNTKVVYQANKNVGFKGETKIEFILKGNELKTAYPVK